MIRQLPVIPTILVVAAAGIMVWLGFWQLGRADEKAELIARYEAARTETGFTEFRPSNPQAAFARVIVYCAETKAIRSTSGRNANGQNGWVHVARCVTTGETPSSDQSCSELLDLLQNEYGSMNDPALEEQVMDTCRNPDPDPTGLRDVVQSADVVLGWSQSAAPVKWDKGYVAGTVVPSGELGFKIVADPPLAGLQANAKPDPNDLPNNHLAYAGQWFFFALTALVIYWFAVQSRLKRRD